MLVFACASDYPVAEVVVDDDGGGGRGLFADYNFEF